MKRVGKNLLAFFIVVIIVVTGVVCYLMYNIHQIEVALETVRLQHRDAIAEIVADIDSHFDGDAGACRVYDAHDTLLFILRDTNILPSGSEFPARMQRKLLDYFLGGRDLRKLTDNDWIASVSIMGRLKDQQPIENKYLSSLGAIAVDLYLAENNAGITREGKFVLASALEEKFTTEKLLSYCSSIEVFSGITGLVKASDELFNLTLAELSDAQQDYLLYSCGKDSVIWDDFVATIPANPAQIGLYGSVSSKLSHVHDSVRDELTTILGDRMLRENFDVALYYDASITMKLQTGLDESLISSVSLQSDGQTAIDGTVEMINPLTGGIIAYVSGRSINRAPKVFALPVQSTLGDYKAVAEMLQDDQELTYCSLLEYTTVAGETAYTTPEEAIKTGLLTAIGLLPIYEETVRVSELAEFFVSLYADVRPHYVRQVVETGSSKVVYTDKGGRFVGNSYAETNMRVLFAGSPDANYGGYSESYTCGKAFAEFCDKYIITGVIGSDALGYGLSYSDYDMLSAVEQNLRAIAKDTVLEKPNAVDSANVLGPKLMNVREQNSSLVEGLVESWVQELMEIPVVSVKSREVFEALLVNRITDIAGYTRIVGAAKVEELTRELRAVRIERTAELMQYIV